MPLTPLAEAKSIALDVETWIAEQERALGPQPTLRHIAHQLQAEAERVIGAQPGAIMPVPASGAKPPPGAS